MAGSCDWSWSIVCQIKYITRKLQRNIDKSLFFLKQLPSRPEQAGEKSRRSESVERCYYAKRMIMMILMIMVMNVHNLFPLSVKTVLVQTGEKMVVNVPFTDKSLHTGEMFYEEWNMFTGWSQIQYFRRIKQTNRTNIFEWEKQNHPISGELFVKILCKNV